MENQMKHDNGSRAYIVVGATLPSPEHKPGTLLNITCSHGSTNCSKSMAMASIRGGVIVM